MNLYDKIFTPKKYILSDGTEILEKRSRLIVIIPILVLLFYLSSVMIGIKWNTFFSRLNQFFIIISKIFSPDFDYLPNVFGPMFETIKMSLLGSLAGAILSLPFSYLAAQNMTPNKYVSWAVRFLFSILRTVPTIVNALIATFIFGIGSVAGIIAIFIFSFSYVGKITYEQIENADLGAYEALQSMGCTDFRSFLKAVLPQVLPTFITTALYNFEGNVRYASILGYVGAGGIGVLIKHNIGLREYERLGTVLICVFITVVIIENLSVYFRKKLM